MVQSSGLGDLQYGDSFLTIGITDGNDGSISVDATMGAELQQWDENHLLVDGPAGGAIFLVPTEAAVDSGDGVIIMQLVLPAGDYQVTFNMQGQLVVDAEGNDCSADGANPTACTWQANAQTLSFTATVNNVCPYDSRPALNADGTCDAANVYGCPDFFVNVQDLQALLSEMATSLEQDGEDFAGYPIDAHPAPGCSEDSNGDTVCSEDYGNGFINVHDLLGLLSSYAMDYNAFPC